MRFLISPFLLLISFLGYSQIIVKASLDFLQTDTVSELIYGYNQDHEQVDGVEQWGSRRLGGNRMSVFNWENGASNSGADNAAYPNDNRIPSLVGLPWNDKDLPGESYRVFHQENLDAGVTSVITVPIFGWVAADKDGSNLTTPPSDRWDELIFVKPTAFSLNPDLTDGVVYLDESINHLVQTFGDATTANAVVYIALDNEPALWDNTHDKIQTSPPNAADYVQKVIAAAKAVKSVDPNIKIIVGEFAGINIYDFGNAPDWATVGADYDWFISYFLDELKKASDLAGYSLIDIISFHNYPQHKIDINGDFSSTGIDVKSSTSTEDYIRSARMDFSRSLWDESYTEPSWLTNAKLNGESNKIWLRIQNSIDTYFPGIKIMIGEYDYGHDTDVSHGIAVSDLLGAAAQNNIEIINRWDLSTSTTDTYTSLAYQLFRNYDGENSAYGNVAITSTFDNKEHASVWASIDTDDEDLHLIMMNKNTLSNATIQITLNDEDYTHEVEGMYVLDGQSTSIVSNDASAISIVNGLLTADLPTLTVYHLIVKRTKKVSGLKSSLGIGALKTYPNPFNEQLTINLDNVPDGGMLKLVSTTGKLIHQQKITSLNNFHLNTEKIKKGTYILFIETAQFVHSVLVVKK